MNLILFFILFILPSIFCIGYTIVKDRKEYKDFYKN